MRAKSREGTKLSTDKSTKIVDNLPQREISLCGNNFLSFNIGQGYDYFAAKRQVPAFT